MKPTKLILSICLTFTLFSCESPAEDTPVPGSSGTYILNSGNWGDNDANTAIYNPSDKTLAADAFYAANGQKLGDVGQDILVYGNDVFIAVNASQTIFVTDDVLKIKKQVNAEAEGARLTPRVFATYGNKVYVTYYEGYLGEISRDYSVKLCKVGPNPDGVATAGNKLYVANSGGMSYPSYNNTVSAVSTDSFTETSTIEVNSNPAMMAASSDGAYVYVSSYGNYADQPAKLQMITTSDSSVTDLDYQSVSAIAKGKNDVLYILCGGYDENWNPLPGTVYMHDMKNNTPLGSFVTDGTTLPNAYSISAAADGYIYVGCSDYTTTGDVYVFNKEGRLHDKFDSQGLNPIKAY